MILVTGHGRSGTGYTAALLQAAGVDVGHEAIGKDGAVSWPHIVAGELSWLPEPVDPSGFDTVIHQVRHPLKVISSAQTMRDESFDYMFDIIDHPGGKRGLRWYMWSWLKWNEYIEQRASWRYRVEDIEKVWPKLVNLFDIDIKETPDFPDVPKNKNARQHSHYTWADLKAEDEELFRAIKHKAEYYGYKIKIPSISLAMMGGTDKDFGYLPNSLESTKDLHDDFVFINTLSHTGVFPEEMLKLYGARIYEHKWEKNFSLHRNQSLSYCHGDWIVMVDCDECLFGDFESFKMFLAELPEHIVCVRFPLSDVHKEREKMRFNTARCFRRGYAHFKSIVHNQPVIHGGVVSFDGVWIEHYGYDLDAETQAVKQERTESLLLKRLEVDPEDYQAHFYLSQTCGQRGDVDGCLKHCLEYIKNKDNPKMVAWNNSIWFTAAQAWQEKGEDAKAKEVLAQGLNACPEDIDLNYLATMIAVKEQSVEDVVRHGQQYIYTLQAYQKNNQVQRERFTYMCKPEDYGAIVYQLAYIYAQKARNYFKEVTKIDPDKGPEIVFEACRNIGVEFDALKPALVGESEVANAV